MAAEKVNIIPRLLPVAAALFPCLVSVILLIQVNRRYGTSFTTLVSGNRASFQIVVQILAHGLGLLQIYSLRGCYKLSFRLGAFKQPLSLEKLAFGAALATGRIDLALVPSRLFWTVVALGLCMIPSALWAGALTPVVVRASGQSSASINLPSFSQASTSTWNNEFQMQGTNLWNLVNHCQGSGLITTCPVPALQGTLLTTLSSATTSDGSPRNHAKIDSPQWSYSGRSYGVGSSLGLINGTYTALAQSIAYTEYGFRTNVDCIFNASTAYHLEFVESMVASTSIGVYQALGQLPNSYDRGNAPGTGENYAVVSTWSDYRNVLAWSARAIGARSYISLATGIGNYTEFNQSQCEVVFTPSAFIVHADLSAKSITVQPRQLDDSEVSLVPNTTITVNAMNTLNLLSRMSSSFYTSVLGDALTHNLVSASDIDPPTSGVASSIILGSLQDSFTAALDDILGSFAAAQIVLAQDTTPTALTAYHSTTRLGEPLYVYVIAGISIVLFLAQCVELLRQRFWHGLPVFDIFDVRSAIVASSAGGTKLAQHLCTRLWHSTTDSRGGLVQHRTSWSGKADDRALSDLTIQVLDSGAEHEMPKIVIAHDRQKDVPMWTAQPSSKPIFGSDAVDMEEDARSLIQHPIRPPYDTSYSGRGRNQW